MMLGKVKGTVIATKKNEKLVGYKIMIVQPINQAYEDQGNAFVCVDTVGAGIGEIVIVSSGTAARLSCNDRETPIDASIVGIVDNIN
ncbi:EutN/CcmL family microcompartment protein [Microaceticoccus formicicus]|uniref:EutN/CcmL family microcompartment protein n=1 Tax=Microaceticoccus formicicus TaxID=3118105 RepID=UPI003CD03542|nr:EutN/CcmL family microcompartment protein [Peptoniphilaceae bacterium AMB_02]